MTITHPHDVDPWTGHVIDLVVLAATAERRAARNRAERLRLAAIGAADRADRAWSDAEREAADGFLCAHRPCTIDAPCLAHQWSDVGSLVRQARRAADCAAHWWASAATWYRKTGHGDADRMAEECEAYAQQYADLAARAGDVARAYAA